MTEQPPGSYPPPPPGGYPPPPPPDGGGYRPPGLGIPPDSNLVWGILTTLFCCLPLGIVSIVKASQVSGLWAQGRHAEAQQAADSAKKWALWSAIISVAVTVVSVVVIVILAATGVLDSTTTVDTYEY